MRGRIAVAQGAVAGARDHGAVAHDHAADRHLAGGLRGARLGERVIHERLWHKASMAQNQNEGERIAKVIARAGLASRREAEAWIAAGRVAVNGAKITSPALNVTRADKIVVDGKPLPGAERTRLFLYHKPRGLVTTSSDPQGRPTIFGALPKDLPRLISIGRLDLSTEGLLLLTNDGGLARALELPATGWLRRYRVRAYGKVTQAAARRAARRRHGRRHQLRADRRRARPRADLERVDHVRDPRGQEPRGAQRAAPSRAAGRRG